MEELLDMKLESLLKDIYMILERKPDNYSNLINKDIYLPSIQIDRRNVYFIIHNKNNKGLIHKQLAIYEEKNNLLEFIPQESLVDNNYVLYLCELNESNNKALSKRFGWIRPTSRENYKYSFGLGDRLGNASNAHLKLFKGKNIMPVIAQQSIRELSLMERTTTDVIQSASWSVFEEGFTYGWGADGDHVKTLFEVDYAVKAGCTMITLDCTNEIDNEIASLSVDEIHKKYQSLDSDQINYFNQKYLDKEFKINKDLKITFSKYDLEKAVLTFYGAILYSDKVYNKFVIPYHLDFEISMDETPYQTTIQEHYLFANELKERGITPITMAPRFYGEFQKAIDYIGNLSKFEKEYIIHEAIATHFGYKLSIHSGSDKLSVYKIIGKESKNNGWHIKTAGTNWLEALNVIAQKAPEFMLDLYEYAYNNMDDVKEFYVFKAQDSNTIPNPKDISLDNVTTLLENEDSRQILHTMYGSIMNLKNNYKYVYKNKFWEILLENQDLYDECLNKHIGKHLELLQG